MESCECVLANNHIDHTLFSICFVFSFQFFIQLLCISLVSLIFRYSAQILFENALFCWQNARLKNRLFCSKFCRQNLSKPTCYPTCRGETTLAPPPPPPPRVALPRFVKLSKKQVRSGPCLRLQAVKLHLMKVVNSTFCEEKW